MRPPTPAVAPCWPLRFSLEGSTVNMLLRLLVTAAALFVAARFVPGITHTGTFISLLGVALVFGVVNTFVKPILTLFSFPVVLLTLGLFLFVINGLMLMLTSYLSSQLALGFHVEGILPAMIGSLVVTITAALLNFVVGTNRSDDE
jgi:putative membrane protein